MKTTMLWALILLNVALLMSFFSRFSTNHHGAALAQAARRPGDYLMIPGEVTGGNAGVVYMIDTTNGLLSAMTFDESSKRLVAMGKIDLAAYFTKGAEQPGNGNQRGNNPRGR